MTNVLYNTSQDVFYFLLNNMFQNEKQMELANYKIYSD
jgi:hypothetical protein